MRYGRCVNLPSCPYRPASPPPNAIVKGQWDFSTAIDDYSCCTAPRHFITHKCINTTHGMPRDAKLRRHHHHHLRVLQVLPHARVGAAVPVGQGHSVVAERVQVRSQEACVAVEVQGLPARLRTFLRLCAMFWFIQG